LLKALRGTLIGLVVVAVLIAVGWQLHRATERDLARAAAERARQEKLPVQERLAQQAGREEVAREAQAPSGSTVPEATPTPPPPVDLPTPGGAGARKRGPSPPPRILTPLNVKLHVQYSAQVIVDGRDLGENVLFNLALAPGPHRVVVHHPCCEDAKRVVTFSKNQPGQMYKLSLGAARPAQFRVINAPPDARVLVDGVLLGTASDPRPYAMNKPVQRVTATIGDRSLSQTLKAGTVNELDYSKATP
jgi:hypothetical protein